MEHIRQAFNRFAQDYDTQREYHHPGDAAVLWYSGLGDGIKRARTGDP